MFKKLKQYYLTTAFEFRFPYNILAMFTNPFYFVRKNLYRNILELSANLYGSVLDFGCGCKPYKKFFNHCQEYTGCDIEISGHSHRNEEIDVFYDGKNLPFADKTFDGVFSTEVFEHIFNLSEILGEINRVLKKDGLALITVPFVWNEHEVPYDCARYTSYGIRFLMEQAGFEIIEQRKSTLSVEMTCQMVIESIRYQLDKWVKSGYLLIFLQMCILGPLVVLGVVIDSIWPSNESFYGDNILLCKKINNLGQGKEG